MCESATGSIRATPNCMSASRLCDASIVSPACAIPASLARALPLVIPPTKFPDRGMGGREEAAGPMAVLRAACTVTVAVAGACLGGRIDRGEASTPLPAWAGHVDGRQIR